MTLDNAQADYKKKQKAMLRVMKKHGSASVEFDKARNACFAALDIYNELAAKIVAPLKRK